MPQFLRLLVIQRVLISHGLDEIIFATHLLRPVRFIFYILPWNWFNKHKEKRAVRIRLMLEELGPIYVKLGQILSTRRDLIPKDIADVPFLRELLAPTRLRLVGDSVAQVFLASDNM